MVFSSLVFLCIFLPTVFLLYTLVPSLKFRNGLLIVASLIFYAYGEPVYVLLMIFSSLLNYICARLVANENAKRKLVLVLAVVINLGILAVFKYSGFFVESLNSVTGLAIPVPQIDLPIGISFFTFQALSYVIDVYRKTVDAQKNYLYVLLYITFFPQLIAGPIVKYRDISEQIVDREQTAEKIADGMRRFICGLAKKVLIANTMGQTADIIFNAGDGYLSVVTAWLGASWTFVIWGLYHGVFLLLEEFIPILGRLPKVINHIYALLAVTVGFVIFRADTIGQGFDFIGNMFAGFNITDKSLSLALTQLTPWFIVMLVAAVIGCAPIKPIADKFRINGSATALVGKKQSVAQTVLYVLAFALLIWCIIRLSGTSYNPFIYFRF